MTLAELIKQKADIERQIASARADARQAAIADVLALMRTYGLSVTDISSAPKMLAKTAEVARRPVAVKYRDDQGNSWTGRGLKPKWLSSAIADGKHIDDFRV